MSKSLDCLNATTKTKKGLALKPFTPAVNSGVSGGTIGKGVVVAKTSTGALAPGLWPGIGITKFSAVKGALAGKSLAGGAASTMIGGVGNATIWPAAMAGGLAVGAAVLIPVLFAGAAIGAFGASVAKGRERGQGKSWVGSLFLSKAAIAKPLSRSQRGRPLRRIPAPSKWKNPVHKAVATVQDLFKKPEKDKPFKFDRRFSLRIIVPPGEMVVHGFDADGKRIRGNAIDISMHGVKFRAPKKNVQSVEKMVFPSYDVVLKVKQAAMHRQTGNEAVAAIDTFENNADAWMQWIELMTRLDQKE